MQDTLRYFFSAVFQGIAALFTLGVMFFLNYFQKIEYKREQLISTAEKEPIPLNLESNNKVIEKNLVEFLIENGIPELMQKETFSYKKLEKIITEYKNLKTFELSLKGVLVKTSKLSMAILIISIVSLYLVSYNPFVDYILMVFGFFTILLILFYFNQLRKTIIIILRI